MALASGDRPRLIFNMQTEAVRLQVMQILEERHEEMTALVGEEIKRAHANMDAAVRLAVREVIEKAIREAVFTETARLRVALQPVIAESLGKVLAANLDAAIKTGEEL